MKALFQTVRECAVALTILFGLGALVTAILYPAVFARQAAGVVDALEAEGFDVQIKTPIGEASFNRVKSIQLERSDEEILDLRSRVATLNAEKNALLDSLAEAVASGVEITPPAEEMVTTEPPEWALVAGATRSLARQRETLRVVQEAGFPDAVILHFGNWFTSAIIFEERREAEAALRELSDVRGVDDGAYIRALSVYCPQMQPVENEPDLFSCG